MDSFGIGDAYPPPGSSSSLVVRLVAHLLSQVSYRLCVTCLILVPVTHLLNVLLSELLSRGPAKERSFIRRALLLNGGKRHQAFSCCGWGLWALSTLTSLPVWITFSSLPQLKMALPSVPHSHVDVISGAAAATSFVGELFLVQAMLVYEPPGLRQGKLLALATSNALPGSQKVVQAIARLGRSGVARHASAALVVFMGLMLSITGALLLLSVEHMPDIPSRVLYCCLSLVCLIIGASSTHGLGGYLQWGARPDKEGASASTSPSSKRRRSGGGHKAHPSRDDPQKTGRASNRPSSDHTRSISAAAAPAMDEGDLSMGSPIGSGELAQLLQAPEPYSNGDVRHCTKERAEGHSASQSRQESVSCINRKDSGAALEVVDGQQRGGGSDWQFYQPFAGGTVFVGTQAVGWTLFSLTSCYVVILSKALFSGVVHTLRSYLLGGSVLMMTTQTILAVSLLTWRARRAARVLMQPTSRRQSITTGGQAAAAAAAAAALAQQEESAAHKKAAEAKQLEGVADALEQHVQQQRTKQQIQREEGFDDSGQLDFTPPSLTSALRAGARALLLRNVPLCIMYLPSHAFFTMWALTFAFCPPHLTAIFWLLFLPVYFLITLRNEPQHTGARRWPWLCTWLAEHADESLSAWFGSVEVVFHKPESGPKAPLKAANFDQAGKYIFGFHPHGLYPTGAGFLSMLKGFREGLPGITPITLTASVLFYVPGVRDLSCWLGFRQVSRRTFVRALRDEGSVVVCPGGQAELVYAHSSHMPPPAPKCVSVLQHLNAPARAVAAEPAPASAPTAATGTQGAAPAATGTQGAALAATTTQNAAPAATTSHNAAPAATGTQDAAPAAAEKDAAGEAGGCKDGAAGTDADAAAGGGGVGVNGKAGKTLPSAVSVHATVNAGELEGGSTSKEGRDALCASQGTSERGGCGRDLVIYAGHKGFVRLAIEQGSALVPVLALGEVLQLRNLISWPSMQKWTYQRLGFPLPYLIGGRWGITPFPARTPLVYVVGEPIHPPPMKPGTPVPHEAVDHLHAKFYSAMAVMFEAHKHRHPEFAHGCVRMVYSHHKPKDGAKK